MLPASPLICSIGDAPIAQRAGASQGWMKLTTGKGSKAAILKSTLFIVKATIRADPSAETGFPGELSK